jgi:uncharacterized repeat protein (TIGR04076 family)
MKETVVAEVINSQCRFYRTGDKIVVDGPLLNKEKSGNICITALQSFFPFIFALRKGVSKEQLGFTDQVEVQCPDYCAPVVFKLTKE